MCVNVTGLYRCDKLKLALEELPGQQPNIQSITANSLTGHALVLFASASALDDILGALDSCVRALGPGRPAVTSAPKTTKESAQQKVKPTFAQAVPGDSWSRRHE